MDQQFASKTTLRYHDAYKCAYLNYPLQLSLWNIALLDFQSKYTKDWL